MIVGMDTPKLLLVRHAEAAAVAATGLDADRPLTPKGHRQAARLASALVGWGETPTVVASSPWLRARTTAEALRGDAPLVVVPELAAGDEAATARALAPLMGGRLVAVGHEPWLSALAAWLLTGRAAGMRVHFRKGAALALSAPDGRLAAGALVLEGFVPVRWLGGEV
jgi:phosphohistidine phosphatase